MQFSCHADVIQLIYDRKHVDNTLYGAFKHKFVQDNNYRLIYSHEPNKSRSENRQFLGRSGSCS